MTCDLHKFFQTSPVDKPDPKAPASAPFRTIKGVNVVCVECGEARAAFEDGEVRVLGK